MNAKAYWEGYRRSAFHLAAQAIPSFRWRRRLGKAAELSVRDWRSVARAGMTLLVVRLALPMVSFERLLRWAMAVKRKLSTGPEDTREAVLRTAKLVDMAANHHPLPMRCLVRSLALSRFLARRGITTEVRLGVRREGGRLLGHAWVEWRGEPVNDPHEPAKHYGGLAPLTQPDEDIANV